MALLMNYMIPKTLLMQNADIITLAATQSPVNVYE